MSGSGTVSDAPSPKRQKVEEATKPSAGPEVQEATTKPATGGAENHNSKSASRKKKTTPDWDQVDVIRKALLQRLEAGSSEVFLRIERPRKADYRQRAHCNPLNEWRNPHFKRKNHRRRIISDALLEDYAHCLKSGGKIYTITDVRDLHDWMRGCLLKHPLFTEVESSDLRAEENLKKSAGEKPTSSFTDSEDPCVRLIHTKTEEGSKVTNIGRFGHEMHYSVFERK